MALIINCFSLQVFVVIYILTNTVHCGYKEDVHNCWEQIQSAFGNCDTAPECLQYAIKFYVFDENTENANITDQSFAGQSSRQEGPNQLPDDQFFTELGDQLNFTGLRNFIESDPNINAQLSDEQMLERLEENLNFEGLRDFIEADSYIADQGDVGNPRGHYGFDNYAQESNEQIFNWQQDPSNNVQNFNAQPRGQHANLQEILNLSKQYKYRLPTTNEGTDFATLYHRELFKMIVGSGVPKRDQYCENTYAPILSKINECKTSLFLFGKTAISAIKWAFKTYTLPECEFLQLHFPEYKYITDYMVVISTHCVTSPSRRPKRFCHDFLSGIIYH